jgi:hypothetical protein
MSVSTLTRRMYSLLVISGMHATGIRNGRKRSGGGIWSSVRPSRAKGPQRARVRSSACATHSSTPIRGLSGASVIPF